MFLKNFVLFYKVQSFRRKQTVYKRCTLSAALLGSPRRRVKLLVDNTHPWPWLENPDGATCRVSSYSLETRDSLAMYASSLKPPEAHAREMPTHVKGGKTAAALTAVVILGRDHGSKETF